MQAWEHYEKTRNTCCWVGVIAGWTGNVMIAFGQPFGYALWMTGLILDVVGGYNWTKLKNRNPAFCLWGLLAPIGFLGLALLRDKWGETDLVAGKNGESTLVQKLESVKRARLDQ